MKIRELIEILDEAIASLKVAIVANQQRSLETPYTSFEFTQRAMELQEDLEDLVKAREHLISLDPESDAEEHFSQEELERFLRLLELLKNVESHLY
ncbi:MAG: hypothetical protein PWQ79_1617 [Thermococcaceae archaeon]|nr:hypothetical protein [Thermococcaceae archaeon]MDK2914702.1 hypothetical protein [Thermococcaceae archaeon]